MHVCVGCQLADALIYIHTYIYTHIYAARCVQVRALERQTGTEEHKTLSEQLFVVKISLAPRHTR